jgi:DNA-binding transcriptional regulator YiaG
VRESTTNPQIIAIRIKRLKRALSLTYWELSTLFGVRPLTVQRWAAGEFAPRLVHQRTLQSLEHKHSRKLKEVSDE